MTTATGSNSDESPKDLGPPGNAANNDVDDATHTGVANKAQQEDGDDAVLDVLTRLPELEAAAQKSELRTINSSSSSSSIGTPKEHPSMDLINSDKKAQPEPQENGAQASASKKFPPSSTASAEPDEALSAKASDSPQQATGTLDHNTPTDHTVAAELPYAGIHLSQTTSSMVGAYAIGGIGEEAEGSNQAEGSNEPSNPHPQVTTPDEESGLVQAQPVQEEPILTTAELVYHHQQQQPNGRQRFLIIGIPLIILLVCVVVGVSVSLAVGLAKNGNKDTALQVPDDTTGMPSTSNTSTTMWSNDTTNQPTDPTNHMVVQELQQLLPNYTQASLQDPFSPQSQALTWVLHHRDYDKLPDLRKKQLFALATFFYSFQGPNWPSSIQDSWLDDQRHECDWFSNNYGTFTDDGSFQQGITEFTSMDSCSSTGEFVDLALGNVDLSLSAIQPIHIPPEISMLTGLLYLHLYENQIHGNIMEILPTQLFQMTSLLEIGLRKNALTGQIPSELGLLTRLYLVELAGNKLTGRIPSELGATVILTFKVCCNQLTGSLPNELLAPGLANMDEFNVQHNMLTGTIPSEIWTSWTKLVVLQLGDNLFSGQGIPTQLNGSHSLPDLVELDLSHLPLLTGSLPTFELANLATNFNLSIIEMDKSPGLLGEIPEELCFLQDPTCSFEFWWWPTPRNCSLTFECTPNLCGCDCLC